MTRDPLTAFTSALATRIEGRRASTPPHADFADVLARARVMSDDMVPRGPMHRVAEPIAPERVDDEVDPLLVPYVHALRSRIERDRRQRELAPIPTTARARWPWVVIPLAAAAVAVLVISRWVPLGLEATRPQAFTESERTGGFERPEGETATRPGSVVPPAPQQMIVPAPEPEPEQPAEIDSIDPPPEPRPRSPRRSAKRAPNPLVTLEAAAHEAWAAGDLERAESLYRAIIARAGRSDHAELAYGDLFALARQRGGASAQAAVWREYLRAFPKGRFADDVQAGLCRRASASERAACWSRYREAYPRGAHVSESRKGESP